MAFGVDRFGKSLCLTGALWQVCLCWLSTSLGILLFEPLEHTSVYAALANALWLRFWPFKHLCTLSCYCVTRLPDLELF